MMMRIARAKEQLVEGPWLITHEAYTTLSHLLDSRIEAGDLHLGVGEEDAVSSGIGIVKVHGTMMRGVSPAMEKLFGLVDTSRVRETILSMGADPSVKGILLDIDSPGGSATGVEECADAVREVREHKKVIASCEGMMASAAYWVGSQARMVVASNSAKVGSIGVYLPVIDSSEAYKAEGIKVDLIKNKEATYKGAGFDGTSLTDEQREHMQEMVQEIYEEFSGAVKRARSGLEQSAMRGQVFSGKKARANGLVDLTGSYEDALALLKYECRIT